MCTPIRKTVWELSMLAVCSYIITDSLCHKRAIYRLFREFYYRLTLKVKNFPPRRLWKGHKLSDLASRAARWHGRAIKANFLRNFFESVIRAVKYFRFTSFVAKKIFRTIFDFYYFCISLRIWIIFHFHHRQW